MTPKKSKTGKTPPPTPGKASASKEASILGGGEASTSAKGKGKGKAKAKDTSEDYCEYYATNLRAASLDRDHGMALRMAAGDDVRTYDIATGNGKEDPVRTDIGLGILSVTESISQKGTVKFSFYNPSNLDALQQGHEDIDLGIWRKHCPIFLPFSPIESHGKAKNGRLLYKGHHILVAAYPPQPGSKHLVQVRIYDSAPGWLTGQPQGRWNVEGDVRRALRLIWGNGELDSYNIQWVQAAHQDGDTCGTHTILNAWILALGLQPPRQQPRGRTAKERKKFYEDAALLISCAVHGCVHYDTILAFLRCWNFLADPAAEPPADRRFNGKTYAVHDVNNIWLNLPFLRKRSEEKAKGLQEQETTKNPDSSEPSGAGEEGSGNAESSGDGQETEETTQHPGSGEPSGAGDEANNDESDAAWSLDRPSTNHHSPGEGDSAGDSGKKETRNWEPAFWPPAVEDDPCRFVSKRLFTLSDKLKEEKDQQPLEKNPWAYIAAVTEAISLNAYPPDAHHDPSIAGGELTEDDHDVIDPKKKLDQYPRRKKGVLRLYRQTKQKEAGKRSAKKFFSFYNPDDSAYALRHGEPIFIVASDKHLVYATVRVSEQETAQQVAHYYIEDDFRLGLPFGNRRRSLEAAAEQELRGRQWWRSTHDPAANRGKAAGPAFEHTWHPVAPFDALLATSMEAATRPFKTPRTLHLILAAWCLALGVQPPAYLPPDHHRLERYADIDALVRLAVLGYADAALVYAALRCWGWLPRGQVAPEAARFDRTARFATAADAAAHRAWLAERLAVVEEYEDFPVGGVRPETDDERLFAESHVAKLDLYDWQGAAPAMRGVGPVDGDAGPDALRAATADAEVKAALQAAEDALRHYRRVAKRHNRTPLAAGADAHGAGDWTTAAVLPEDGEDAREEAGNLPVVSEEAWTPRRLSVVKEEDEESPVEGVSAPSRGRSGKKSQEPESALGQRGKKRKLDEVSADDDLVVNEDSEVYGLMKNAHAGGRRWQKGIKSNEMAKLFTNAPEPPTGKGRTKMVDAADKHFGPLETGGPSNGEGSSTGEKASAKGNARYNTRTRSKTAAASTPRASPRAKAPSKAKALSKDKALPKKKKKKKKKKK